MTILANPSATFNGDPLQRLLSLLPDARQTSNGHIAKCPAHKDRRPSLTIGTGDDGRVLLKCFAGCTTAAIVEALGLTMADLFPAKGNGDGQRSATGRREVAAYPYRSATGELLYETVRYEPKDFRQRRPDGDGWIWNLGDVARVLYRLPELLTADSAALVFIVEGERDVDNLRQIDLVATCNPMGAMKWSKLSDDSVLHGRHVVIIPDRDKPGQDHAQDVASRLHGKAASVKVIDLGAVEGFKGKDVSDYIDWRDSLTPEELRAALLAMVTAASVWTPTAAEPVTAPATVDEDEESGAGLGSVKMLADTILKQCHFARDEGGKLYVFSDGVYRAGGEKTVRKLVKRVLEDCDLSEKWSTHRADEVVQYIVVDAPELWPAPPVDRVNVRNGLLTIVTGELRPHDPSYLSPIQLPVNFDPKATCPAWDRFIEQTFPADALAVAWQILAWLMLPYTSIQKAVLLLGEGANGKSTFLAALVAFIGKQNIAALSLHKLEADKFSAARLVGKLANVCPDLPSAHLAGTSTFKALVGGDVLLGERKYADSFEFSPFARLIFSANHPPRSADASHAFFRRWLVVPFGRTFDPAQQIPRNVLDTQLADPRELSGALNMALAVLPDLHAHGFVESESMRDAWNEFRESTDPLSVWLDSHTVEGPDVLVSKSELLLAYNADARHDQRPTLTGKGLGQALKRLRPRIEEAQRTIAGAVAWVWLGIGLQTDGNVKSAQTLYPAELDNPPGF